ncbi:MAG TPA: lysophospholipid acyltransferase family protein [bacterium]|nr:lysophospholipid acyltransferase family protein [bacterium]HPN29422.1 lysophospholipid acyltransferase family protein [bacterium]
MKKIPDILRTIFFYAGIFIITVAVCIGIVLAALLKKEKTARIFFKKWGKYIVKLTGSTVSLEGLENLDFSSNYLFCPNHSSAFDIYALSGYLPFDFAWISKETYFKIPLLAEAMRNINCIEMNRTNPKKAFASLKKAADIIRDKKLSIAIFPEGTRSPDGKLQDFKRGSLYLAVETGLKIIPVTIIGAFDILPKKRLIISRQNVKIIFSKPLNPPDKNKETQRKTIDEIKNIIKNNLENSK